MRYGLIGEHLGHSYSREIHEFLTGDPYELRELSPEEVGPFLISRAFSGINVTIPYKTAVLPYLDRIDPPAQKIGAVNTVVNQNGKLVGYNTDYDGMRALFQHAAIDVFDRKVLILGTGGTSSTAMAVLRDLGAREVWRVSRKSGAGVLTYEQAVGQHNDAQIIVNTTPVGMFPNEDACPIDLSRFPSVSGVVDAVYHPLRTNLVLQAKRRGIAAVGGLYMLCAQAVRAVELFRDTVLEASATDRVFSGLHAQKRNIVLIGMPTCGKSTVGRMLATLTGKPFIDTDEKLTEKIGSIPEYIKKYGEAAFRGQERTVIAELSPKRGCIIATGGGAVLDENNVMALARNGVLVFLNRSPEKLTATADRPLSCNVERLTRLYGERLPVYLSAADMTVNGDGSIEQVAQAVIDVVSEVECS